MKMLYMLAATTALSTAAFMSDVSETVTIKGAGGKPLRVNKSDYDADQAEGGANEMTLHKVEADQSAPGLAINTGQPLAAPSAPDFTAGGQVIPTLIDPLKDAAAPGTPSPNNRLVSKEGSKFFIVDGSGEKVTEFTVINQKGYATEDEAWAVIKALPH